MNIARTLITAAILLSAGCAGTYQQATARYEAARPAAPAATPAAAPAPAAKAAPASLPVLAAPAGVIPFIDPERLDPEKAPDRLVLLMLETDPAISAARKNLAAARATYAQERYIADTLAQIQAFTGRAAGPPLPLPGAESLRSRLVALEVKEKALALEQTIAGQSARLLGIYHALARNRADRATAEEMRKLFSSLKKTLLVRYGTGAASYGALATATARLARAENKLRDLAEEEKSLLAAMAEFVPASAAGDWDRGRERHKNPGNAIPVLPAAAAVERLSTAQALAPRLAATRAARLQAMLDLAAAMAAPDFTAGLSERRGSDVAGSFREDAAPPAKAAFKPAALAYLARLEQERDAARAKARAASRAAQAKARRLWQEADQARRRILLLRKEIIPVDESVLAAKKGGFSAGTATFAELAAAADRLFTDRFELAAARMRLGRKTAELSASVGRYLEVSP